MYTIVMKTTVVESASFFTKLLEAGHVYNVKYSPDFDGVFAWFTIGPIVDIIKLHEVTSDINDWPEPLSYNIIED